MKSSITLLIGLLASASAFADGFVCETLDGELAVKMYNQTEPKAGTRNAAILVLSDRTVSEGRQTIATFSAENDLVENDSALYVADVDLRYTESGRGGENVLGTKLAKVDTVTVDVDFYYGQRLKHGEEVKGKITLLKRDGDKIKAELVCSRYLKN